MSVIYEDSWTCPNGGVYRERFFTADGPYKRTVTETLMRREDEWHPVGWFGAGFNVPKFVPVGSSVKRTFEIVDGELRITQDGVEVWRSP